MLRRRASASAGLSAIGAVVLSCLGPTEIVLDVRTNVPCTGAASWRGVAVSVGQPGVDVESRAPVLTTTACSTSGEVGTLVVVPSGSDGAEVGIRVVAGITRNPEDCAANGYEGCIVTRRTLTYLPHQSQKVVVDLTGDCISNACDINHTCANGSCTDTVTARPPVAPDGGVVSGPTVRCGDDATTCRANDTGSVCCVAFDYDAGTGTGECVAPHDCPSTSAALYCDDSTDCPVDGDAGDPIVCCGVTTVGFSGPLVAAQCVPYSTCRGMGAAAGILTPILCQDRAPCPVDGANCGPSASPGYFTCH